MTEEERRPNPRKLREGTVEHARQHPLDLAAHLVEESPQQAREAHKVQDQQDDAQDSHGDSSVDNAGRADAIARSGRSARTAWHRPTHG